MGLKNFAVQKKRYAITIQRLECSETNFRVSFRVYAFNLDASDLATFYKVLKRPCPLLSSSLTKPSLQRMPDSERDEGGRFLSVRLESSGIGRVTYDSREVA